jgi:hypothetical protein
LASADKKKTDVEERDYKGRVKSVKWLAFKIEEKFGKQVRTQVSTPHWNLFLPNYRKYDEKGNNVEMATYAPSGRITRKVTDKYDEKGNSIIMTEYDVLTGFGETRLVPKSEWVMEFTYWDD